MNKRDRNRSPGRRAFTLIELLVVIAVIGLLVALTAPVVGGAFESGRSIQCQNNLRQMVIAAHLYAADNDGALPPSWQRDAATGETLTWESFLWEQGTDFRIQQCPSFKGKAMWKGDRYTGYNYNASYLGGRLLVRGETVLPGSLPSARVDQILNPAECAMFGDGQYRSGANKFMRSPQPGLLDADASAALGGTQGYRHNGRTNIGFADGHVESIEERHTATAGFGKPADDCGFISPDNRLYDLE